MTKERIEELAALHALGLIDEAELRELRSAAATSPEADSLLREMQETAALLAHEPEAMVPPARLKEEILRNLPARSVASQRRPVAPRLALVLAACLAAAVIIWQAVVNAGLNTQVAKLRDALAAQGAQVAFLREYPPSAPLRVALLDLAPRGKSEAGLASSRVLVAWDPAGHRGTISLQDMPAAPAGKDYELWVLDPKAPAPLSAGVVTHSRSFEAKPASAAAPQFAISLEPEGGSPAPTGPILFVSAAEK